MLLLIIENTYECKLLKDFGKKYNLSQVTCSFAYVKDFETRHLEVENLKDIQSTKNSNKNSHSQRR